MLHGAMVLTKHPRARVLKIHDRRGSGDARRGARLHRRRRARIPRHRPQRFRTCRCSSPKARPTCCVADFLAMVVADTQFHARQAAAKVEVDYEVLEPLTDPFEALKPERAAGPFDRARSRPGRRTCSSRSPRSRAATSTRRSRRRARHRGDVRDAAGRHRVSRARGVPGDAAGEGRQGPHRQPGIDLRPAADRQGPEARSRATSRSRWRRAAARSARRRSCRSRRRRRSPRTCSGGRSRPCSRASSRRSTTSSAMR